MRLFDRTPKGLVPTVYGDALSVHARSVESELRNAEREIALLSGAAKGEVRVGVTPSIAASLAPRVAKRLLVERPGIELTIIEGLVDDHVPALRRGEIDLIVGGWARGMEPDLRTEAVFRDVVRAWARRNHPLHGARVPLSRLSAFPWVMPPHTQFWFDHFDRAFVAKGLSPPLPSAISNSASFIRSMLLDSNCLSYLPSLLLQRYLDPGEIAALDVPELDVEIDVHVTHRATSALPASVSVFIDAVREESDRFARAPLAKDGAVAP